MTLTYTIINQNKTIKNKNNNNQNNKNNDMLEK